HTFVSSLIIRIPPADATVFLYFSGSQSLQYDSHHTSCPAIASYALFLFFRPSPCFEEAAPRAFPFSPFFRSATLFLSASMRSITLPPRARGRAPSTVTGFPCLFFSRSSSSASRYSFLYVDG